MVTEVTMLAVTTKASAMINSHPAARTKSRCSGLRFSSLTTTSISLSGQSRDSAC